MTAAETSPTVFAAADSAAPGHLAGTDSRYGLLDVLRAVSVFGVVWFHAHAPGDYLAYAGLPALLILTVSLQVARRHDAPWSSLVRHRARRLLGPWLFWSAFYGVIAAYGVVRGRSSWSGAFPPFTLLVGTAIHLWYLPFAFVAAMFAHAVVRTLPSRRRSMIGISAVLALATLLVMGLWLGGPNTPPLPQWIFGAASIPMGCALGLAAAQWRRSEVLAWTGVVALISFFLAARGLPNAMVYAIALVAVGAGLTLRGGAWPGLQRLSDLSFGVYLLHPAVNLVGAKWDWFGASRTVIAISTIVGSMLLTWGLRRTWVKAFL